MVLKSLIQVKFFSESVDKHKNTKGVIRYAHVGPGSGDPSLSCYFLLVVDYRFGGVFPMYSIKKDAGIVILGPTVFYLCPLAHYGSAGSGHGFV